MSSIITNPFLYYHPVAVAFDGTNDGLLHDAQLTGVSDGKQLTFSVWIKFGAFGTQRRIFSITSGATLHKFTMLKSSTDNFVIAATNSASTTILIISTATAFDINSGWRNLLASIDLSDTNKRHLYISDTSDLIVTTYTNDNMDFTQPRTVVGFDYDQTNKITADIADLWFDDSYLDLSIEANRRKFISGHGKPVYLGESGELPLGAAPLCFFSGALNAWETNKGTGGGFTEVGTLAEATTNPGD